MRSLQGLFDAAESLSLPCFDLVPAGTGDHVAAHWGGRRSDLPEGFPKGVGNSYKGRRHFLSVEQRIFDALGLVGRGPVILVEDTTVDDVAEIGCVNGIAGNFEGVAFDGSIPLCAKASTSLPPLEAVSLYGGDDVRAWLASEKLQRWQYSNVARDVQEAYLKHVGTRSPIYASEPPFARVGGWHRLWPDDDFYIPREMRLMIWTFKDAEPWHEVFLSPMGSYIVKSRIT